VKLTFGGRGARRSDDDRVDALSPDLVGYSDDRGLGDARVKLVNVTQILASCWA
jgi:hypothetical protein